MHSFIGCAGLPSASPSSAPRKIQSQWSVPEENCQWPLRMYPPSVGVATPLGMYGEAIHVFGSEPHTSSCSRRSHNAISHGCTPPTPHTQPVEPHAFATAITASAKSRGCAAYPPKSVGCSSRITPVSRISFTLSSDSLPRRSVSSAAAAS